MVIIHNFNNLFVRIIFWPLMVTHEYHALNMYIIIYRVYNIYNYQIRVFNFFRRVYNQCGISHTLNGL